MVCAMANVTPKRVLGMAVTAADLLPLCGFVGQKIVNVWTPIMKIPAKLLLVLLDGLVMGSVTIFVTMKKMVSMEVTAAEMMHCFFSVRNVHALNDSKLAYDFKHLIIQ